MIPSRWRRIFEGIVSDDSFKKIVTYSFFGFLPILSGVVLTPVYTRLLSVEEYGKLSYYNLWMSYFTLLAFLGLDNSVARYFFEYKNDLKTVHRMFATTFQFIAAACLLLLLLTYLFAEKCGLDELRDMYVLLPGNVAFASAPALFLLYYQNQQKLNDFAKISLLQFVTISAGSVAGILFFSGTAQGCYSGRLAFQALLLLLLGIRNPGYFFCRADLRLLREMLKFGLPFIPYAVLGAAYDTADRIIIEREYSFETLGIYNSAFVIGFLINVVVNALMQTYSPKIMRHLHDTSSDYQLIRLRNNMSLIVSAAAVLLSLVGYPVILVVAGRQYVEATYIIPLLAFCFLLRFYYVIYSVPIFFLKKSFLLPFIMIAALAVFLISYYSFGRHFGLIGIVLSLLLSRIGQIVMTRYLVKKAAAIKADVVSGLNHRAILLSGVLCVVATVCYFVLFN